MPPETPEPTPTPETPAPTPEPTPAPTPAPAQDEKKGGKRWKKMEAELAEMRSLLEARLPAAPATPATPPPPPDDDDDEALAVPKKTPESNRTPLLRKAPPRKLSARRNRKP